METVPGRKRVRAESGLIGKAMLLRGQALF